MLVFEESVEEVETDEIDVDELDESVVLLLVDVCVLVFELVELDAEVVKIDEETEVLVVLDDNGVMLLVVVFCLGMRF